MQRRKVVRVSFPGYVRLVGPESLTIGSLRVQSVNDYRQWQAMSVALSNAKTWQSQEKAKAYVNFGRWLIDCVWCKKGVLTRPDWGVAFCATCGARYEQGMVIFPSDPRIENALLLRPNPDTQHWDDRQTAEDLLRENKELHLDTTA